MRFDEKKMEYYDKMTDHVIEILDEMDDEEFIMNVLDITSKAEFDKDPKFQEYDREFGRWYDEGIDPDTAAYKLLAIIKKLMT